jgi:hypothetical protein
MAIKAYAEKEMKRMNEIMKSVKISSKNLKAKEFLEFAANYHKDGIYFYKEKKYEEAFEAFIIAWAYIDISLKLGFAEVPKDIQKFFTA